LKEIHFTSGFPTNEWVGVEYIPRYRLPSKMNGTLAYLPDKFKILEGECEGMEVSPKAPFIEVRTKIALRD